LKRPLSVEKGAEVWTRGQADNINPVYREKEKDSKREAPA